MNKNTSDSLVSVEKRQSLARCTTGGALVKILQGKKPKCSFWD